MFTIGNVHPANFGVNDFDKAWVAPFSYDVKRGAVGFYIIAKEMGLKRKHCCEVVDSFVDGYLKALEEFASDDRENTFQFRIDNSPKMIQKLLNGGLETCKAFLEDLIERDHALGVFKFLHDA